MINLLKIGHVHIKVLNLKKAEEFYIKIFGFKVSERVGSYLFLTFEKEHHDLALQEIKNAKRPSDNMTGLYHFAIELDNLKQLANIYLKLKKYNVKCTPINHGISKSIYFSDPDGNGIEVYVDTRQVKKKWQGVSTLISKEKFTKYKK